MANTTSLGLHAPIGADPQEPASAPTRLTDPTDVAILAEQLGLFLPHPGDLMATATATARSGWLLCNGAEVSLVDYHDLWEAIGTTYGGGSEPDLFKLPDLRGRVPVGVDGSAGRLTANDALGQSGGAEKHTLSVGEMPSHDHGTDLPSTSFVTKTDSFDGSVTVGGGGTGVAGNGARVVSQQKGGGQAHNNMQPYLVINWLIKT